MTASGCCAHRGRLHHVGIRFARRGWFGRRRAAGFPVGRRWSLGARAVGEAKCRCRGVGLSDHVGIRFAHRGTSERRRVRGAQSQRSGTVARLGLFGRRRPPSFERVGRSGRWARLERRAEVTDIGRAFGGVAIAPLAADSKRRGLFGPFVSGQGSFGHSGHQVGSRRTAGVSCTGPGWVSPPVASPRAAWRVIRQSWLFRT